MKRRLVNLVVFLLLGAIVNVAVAWGYIIWPSPLLRSVQDHGNWPTSVPADWPDHPDYRWVNSRPGFTEIQAYAWRPEVEWHVSWAVESGLPSRTLYVERHKTRKEIGTGSRFFDKDWSQTSRDGVAFPSWIPWQGRFRAFPIRPIWPGFAINTLFYAGVLWLLFAAPFALRRHRRIKHGLCPKCAYPIGESPVCTECGNLVKGRHVEPE